MKWLIAVALTAVVSGQQLDLGLLDKLASRAKSSVNVTLDEDKLKFASGFLSGDDVNQTAAKNIVSGLKAINVRVFEFDSPGQFTRADLDAIRSQLKGPGWSKMVEAKDGDELAEIYMFSKGKEVGGLTIIASEKKELSIVNIVGPIDLKTLGSLGGKFGIPKDLGSTLPKPLSPPKSPDKKDD
jgi:hypothetical protein